MAFPDSVLIVDDDPAILVALSDMLAYRLRDVRVTTRESAITGLEALRNTNYIRYVSIRRLSLCLASRNGV